MNKKKIIFITLLSNILLTFLLILLAFIVLVFIFGEDVLIHFFYLVIGNFIANNITTFYILNSKKRIINVKLCWIFVINALPIIGLFSFFIFGIIPFKIKSMKEIKKLGHKFFKYENYQFTNKFIKQNTSLNSDFLFIHNYTNSPIYENNKIDLIDQSNLFLETIKLIKSAKEFIHIQYYIISNSVWFYFLCNELIKKASEGIKIRFIFDWVGSSKRFSKKTINKLKNHGVEIAIFNPKRFSKFTSVTNFRSHKKILLVDNKYCITGGSNIGDEYLNLKKNYDNWKDLNFFIEGEIVNSINLGFCNDWLYYTDYSKKCDDLDFYKKFKIHKYDSDKKKSICQLVSSSPEFDLPLFQSLVSSLISSAKKNVWIFTPYLLIPDEIMNQIIYASIKGVDVKIMVPHFPDDKKFILIANRSIYQKLLNANVKIYEYYGFMHSKGIIIDDNQVLIGTNNMDFRSLIINFETSILVLSNILNKKLKKIFLDDEKNSLFVTQEFLRLKINLKTKLLISLINIIRPLL